MGDPKPPLPPAAPLKVARTAPERKTANVHEVHDTVIVIFDKPLSTDVKPDHDAFELSSERKKLRKTRATTETIDEKHVAIRFEGLKPGVYALARDEGHGLREDLFGGAQYPYVAPSPPIRRGQKPAPAKPASVTDDDALEGLVGLGLGSPQYVPKQYFTVTDKPPTARDEDLKSAPVYFDQVSVVEPKLAKPVK